jgi:hypothetical protein
MIEAVNTARIRELNDELRRTGQGGRVMVTQGVAALGPERRREILAAVQEFDDFTSDNDPHGEHDFGAAAVTGARLFWKIDYYDCSLTQHSPDPADPHATARVLTIMLADEY